MFWCQFLTIYHAVAKLVLSSRLEHGVSSSMTAFFHLTETEVILSEKVRVT